MKELFKRVGSTVLGIFLLAVPGFAQGRLVFGVSPDFIQPATPIGFSPVVPAMTDPLRPPVQALPGQAIPAMTDPLRPPVQFPNGVVAFVSVPQPVAVILSNTTIFVGPNFVTAVPHCPQIFSLPLFNGFGPGIAFPQAQVVPPGAAVPALTPAGFGFSNIFCGAQALKSFRR